MNDPLSNPLVYRLWRLRRMILTGFLLPLAAVVLLHLATGGTAYVSRPVFAVPTLSLWLVLLIAMLMAFPRGLAEAFVHSLTLSTLVLISPLAELLVAQVTGLLTAKHFFGLAFLTFVAWIALAALIDSLLGKIAQKGPRPMLRRTASLWVDMPPEETLLPLRPVPGHTTALHRWGPVDAQGRIPVWTTMPPLPSGCPAQPAAQPGDPNHWLQVLQETPTSISTLAVTQQGRTETMHTELIPARGGTLILRKSASDALTLFESLFFALGDMSADYVVATLDSARNHSPQRAIWLLPIDSLIPWLARKMASDDPRRF